MAGADNKVAQITGAVQNHFQKSWMDQERRMFETPLANSTLGMQANIPKNGGQYAEFRKFDDYAIPTGTGSSPKYYAESDGDPASGITESSTVIQVPLAEIRHYISLGNIVRATDPIDLVEGAYTKFQTQIRRWIHRHVNDAFVRQISDTNSYTGGSNLPSAFNTVFAGGAESFADVAKTSVFTTEDFKKAKAALKNDGVPEVYPGLHVAIIDYAIAMQLESDPYFREVVMRGYKTDAVFGNANCVDIYGIRFVIQNDEYRCNLASAGGALTTRADSGAVHLAHVLGKNAFAYVDLGDKTTRKRLMGGTGFKVQDISKTGIELTIGYNIPFKTAVIDADYGLNIAGCTNYDQTVASYA